jgi:integrase
MDNLTYDLRLLCRRNRDGSYATQADRLRSLTLVSRQLLEAGFRRMRGGSIKSKHVEALLQRWRTETLSPGTVKNRLAHLRWWAEKVGKASAIPADNSHLGIPNRRFVTNENKAQQLDDIPEQISDPYVRISLALQQAFGLRREECIKFRPSYADRGDHIALKKSWTKGGRARIVPITVPEQRSVLDRAHQLAQTGSLIPAAKTYIQQRNTYDGECRAAGLNCLHGLRHRYAQVRYAALTGWKAPTDGGPTVQMLTSAQREQDARARQTITRELGHGRSQITAVYLGR